MLALLLSIRFHDGRYHGAGDWPPSPARLFQALVAGAARGASLPDEARQALEWLEKLPAPLIAAPPARETRGFKNYVPNNDLDAVGGDPTQIRTEGTGKKKKTAPAIGFIKTEKWIRPWFFDAETRLLYAWNFPKEDEEAARRICASALGLYQLGCGVDMAWADGAVLPLGGAALDDLLCEGGQRIWRPSEGAGSAGTPLACPMGRSLASLIERHQQAGKRLTTVLEPAPAKKAAGQIFRQPPKPRFRQVAYDSPSLYLSFDIIRANKKGEARFAPQPLVSAVDLVTRIRDAAANRLRSASPQQSAAIDRIFIGRDAAEADKAQRLRIVPLPSIGFVHADHMIRRVVVEIPPNCPLAHGDIEWAFSGLVLNFDPDTGEIADGDDEIILARSSEQKMLAHYAIGSTPENSKPAHVWRTVTPAALTVARRRIDPARMRQEAKGGNERADEEAKAASAVMQALRHAGVTAGVEALHVQREPFEARGARAEAFATGARFSKERLWQVEIAFAEPISGPLIIGDGRYLGLGLLRHVKRPPENAFAFEIAGDTLVPVNRRIEFLRAVRRALMAIDRDHSGGERVSRLFSGHEDDGAPARSGTHDHVFLAATAEGDNLSKLYVLSPTVADHRTELNPSEQQRFSAIVRNLELVRAGKLGVIRLAQSSAPLANSALTRPSRVWVSETAYIPTRHLKAKNDRTEWLVGDVLRECARRGLPRPEIEVLSFETKAKSKPGAYLRLTFETRASGPILIGQGAHSGSGLFRAALPEL